MTNKRKHFWGMLTELLQLAQTPHLRSEGSTASSVKGEWYRLSKMKITFIFHFDTHKTTTAQQGKHNSYTKHM